MPNIYLDQSKINKTKDLAQDVANDVHEFVKEHSSVSVERAVLRLYGVNGVDKNGTPLPNLIVDLLKKKGGPGGTGGNGGLGVGISSHFASALLQSKRDAQATAELILDNKIDFGNIHSFSKGDVKAKENEIANEAIALIDKSRNIKQEKQNRFKVPPTPWRYLIVATGNIYEDRTQAKAAVMAGADIIAVIRSTAQSLLDYVPYGATTTGFGGTFATQENFKIMRAALDEACEEFGRYIRLVNYSSGLCMAEIASCAALENLDMLLNDSMYGILFRDINAKRTFIDQYFSRLICARSKIIINTGEDNYLTTADAIENAYTVTASQLINEALAKKSLLTEDLMGLGHAYEINPKIENAFLYELAHAELARALFPHAPLKYMPPTKYKSTDIFYSHSLDTMFNLTSVTTHQGIHLAGILTEAIHTPLMQDRYKALASINYVFNVAKNFGDEIEYKKDGFIVKRATQVLDDVLVFLEKVKDIGLMNAIAEGAFADVKRLPTSGKGLDGVFKKELDYSNPIMDKIEMEGVIK
ncbi:MAG: D-lysine 5,6-aminomutase subunit alpha [Oligoflexia bacterium]|nr:D-lysine 5,6-aminomutase subunit alpha [Oligoflexia bacterium]